jgi:hypothetical protein
VDTGRKQATFKAEFPGTMPNAPAGRSERFKAR